jgi:hypothetical protein
MYAYLQLRRPLLRQRTRQRAATGYHIRAGRMQRGRLGAAGGSKRARLRAPLRYRRAFTPSCRREAQRAAQLFDDRVPATAEAIRRSQALFSPADRPSPLPPSLPPSYVSRI